jgi:hypothetical protein
MDVLLFRGLLATHVRGPSSVPKHVARQERQTRRYFSCGTREPRQSSSLATVGRHLSWQCGRHSSVVPSKPSFNPEPAATARPLTVWKRAFYLRPANTVAVGSGLNESLQFQDTIPGFPGNPKILSRSTVLTVDNYGIIRIIREIEEGYTGHSERSEESCSKSSRDSSLRSE